MEILFYVSQFGDNPFALILTFMRNGGVFLFIFMLIYAAWKGWVSWVQNTYAGKKKFVLLAIDVPRVNEQSMRAVEQIIATLHGVHQGPNKKELYWDGVIQDSFALEIVSISGYIQYFVRCDDYNADLVKGAFFAQYPDAEIIEVEDYTQNAPETFPDETMDLWGSEFVLANKSMYPIKTYEQFEHSLTGVFADPMAAILEVLSRLRPGEQVWLQFVITPVGSDWREEGLDEVNKLAGKVVAKKSRLGALGQIPAEFVDEFRRQAFSLEGEGLAGGASGGGAEVDFNTLTSGERLVIEEVQKKIARLAFDTKFRMLYIAPKDVMHGMRVVGSVFGSIKQFNTLDLNAFTGGKTSTGSPTYFNVKRRQNQKKNSMIRAYRSRDNWAGDNPYPMSTTELATLFHFPIDTVRAPLVARTVSKKSEPPTGLPLEMSSPFEQLKHGNASGAGTGPEPQTRGTLEEDGLATRMQRDLPAGLIVPAAAAIPTPAETTPPPGAFPLHSMPGLPPGVVPVGHAAQPQAVPVQPQPQVFAPQVVPPPEHFAPLQQQPQMQQPPVQPQMQQPQAPVQAPQVEPSHQQPQAGGPPTNLPIG